MTKIVFSNKNRINGFNLMIIKIYFYFIYIFLKFLNIDTLFLIIIFFIDLFLKCFLNLN
jgi:hypothetical protein